MQSRTFPSSLFVELINLPWAETTATKCRKQRAQRCKRLAAQSFYTSALQWQLHLPALRSSKIFINCVGPQDVFWFCKLFCRLCLPVPLSWCALSHTQCRGQVHVFYNSKPEKTRTFLISLKIKQQQQQPTAALKDVFLYLFPLEGCNVIRLWGEVILTIPRKVRRSPGSLNPIIWQSTLPLQ